MNRKQSIADRVATQATANIEENNIIVKVTLIILY